MRKRTASSRHTVGKLLSPQQITDLLIGPRMGFQLLCAGTANVAHVQSLLGLFNLIAALIVDTRHRELQPYLLDAQHALANLEQTEPEGGLRLSADHQAIVGSVLQYIDRILRMTDQGLVNRAVRYVNRSFAGQTRAAIVPWDKLRVPQAVSA